MARSPWAETKRREAKIGCKFFRTFFAAPRSRCPPQLGQREIIRDLAHSSTPRANFFLGTLLLRQLLRASKEARKINAHAFRPLSQRVQRHENYPYPIRPALVCRPTRGSTGARRKIRPIPRRADGFPASRRPTDFRQSPLARRSRYAQRKGAGGPVYF